MPSKKDLSFQFEFCDRVWFSNVGMKRDMSLKINHFPRLSKLYLQIVLDVV